MPSKEQLGQLKGTSRNELIDLYFSLQRKLHNRDETIAFLQAEAKDLMERRREVIVEKRELRLECEAEIVKAKAAALAALGDRNLCDLVLDSVSMDEQFNTWNGDCCTSNSHPIFLGCYLPKGHSLYFCRSCWQITLWGIVAQKTADYWPVREPFKLSEPCESSLLALYLAKRMKLI